MYASQLSAPRVCKMGVCIYDIFMKILISLCKGVVYIVCTLCLCVDIHIYACVHTHPPHACISIFTDNAYIHMHSDACLQCSKIGQALECCGCNFGEHGFCHVPVCMCEYVFVHLSECTYVGMFTYTHAYSYVHMCVRA